MPVAMQPAKTERRAHATRVPLDLWIRLAHEDYEETFDADGVDISTGGLALRADYLPEVGDRLRCSFESPPTGEEIAVDGQVVWAHEAGERSGEFGLRFAAVDEHVQEHLRELVRHLRGDASKIARLHLDGVASPIEAEVLEHDARWMTVEQELPFLRIGMGITLEGAGAAPRGQLASVDLRIVDGVPRLVLAVELGAEALADDEDGYDEDGYDEEAYGEELDEPEGGAAAHEDGAVDRAVHDQPAGVDHDRLGVVGGLRLVEPVLQDVDHLEKRAGRQAVGDALLGLALQGRHAVLQQPQRGGPQGEGLGLECDERGGRLLCGSAPITIDCRTSLGVTSIAALIRSMATVERSSAAVVSKDTGG